MIFLEILLYQLTKNVSIVKVEHNSHVPSVGNVRAATGRKRNWIEFD